MQIAVACDGLAIAPSFAQCTSFMCYTVENGTVTGSRNMPALDRNTVKLPELLKALDIDTLLVNSIDDEIARNLQSGGLRIESGKTGDPLTAVRSFLVHELV